jgi:hypothetical protein
MYTVVITPDLTGVEEWNLYSQFQSHGLWHNPKSPTSFSLPNAPDLAKPYKHLLSSRRLLPFPELYRLGHKPPY